MSATDFRRIDPHDPDPDLLRQAAAIIRRGGLVAFPTETVYGLGANATDADAVARIYTAKNRPASDPVIVHIASIDMLAAVAIDIPDQAIRLARAFWAGALTLVLNRHPSIPRIVSAGGDTVAVRMPNHPVALGLIAAANVPIAAPSANSFSRPSATTAQHVLEDLGGRIDMILDGGATPIGLESTIIDLTGDPVVLRPGGVPLEALRSIVPDVQVRAKYLDTAQTADAPGQMIKHYSPRAELVLFDGQPDAVIARIRSEAQQRAANGQRVGILTRDQERAAFDALPAQVITLGSEPETIGAALFAAIRDLDRSGVDAILVRALDREGIGLAIHDRLVRAAEGRITHVE